MLRSSTFYSSGSDSSTSASLPSAISCYLFLSLSALAAFAASASLSFFAYAAYFIFYYLVYSAYSSGDNSSKTTTGSGSSGLYISSYPKWSRIQGIKRQDWKGLPLLISAISFSLKPIYDRPGTTLFGKWASS
jgi:hypothetical protein